MMKLFGSSVLIQSLKYYYLDIWNENGYYSTNSLDLLNKGPWYVILFCLCIFYYFLHESQKMKKKQVGYDLKPWRLIWNGYNFGVSGILFLIFLIFLCNCNLYKCTFPKTLQEETATQMFIYFLIMSLINRFTSVLDTLFLIWSKISLQISFGLLVENLMTPIMYFFFVKFYSPGLTPYLVLFDSFFNCVNYGILTKASADPGSKSSSEYSKIIKRLKMLHYMFQNAVLLYFLNYAHCTCSPILSNMLITINTTIFFTYIFPSPSHLF